jgi:myosin heavy subunit
MTKTKELKIKIDGVVQYVKVVESATKTTENLTDKLKDVIKLNGELSEQEKKNSDRRQNGFKLINDLHKSFETQYNNQVANGAKMLAQSQKVAATISQINDLNQEAYKLLTKNNQEKMTAVQSEIDALAKNAKSVETVTKAYEKKKQAIEEQSAIARAETVAAYNVQIEQAKRTGNEVVSLETAKTEQIKRINDQLNEDLKKNAKEYTASYTVTFNKLMGGLSENMEVYMDTTSTKTKKQVEKTVKEAADLLGLEEKALKGVADGLLKTAAAEQKAAAEVKNTGEEVAKTGDATKKIVDVKATEENIKVIKQLLNSYRADLKETGQATIKYYDDEIKAADNVEKRKELEAKRAEVVTFYGEQLIAVSKAITAAEKKEQDLGLLQWKQYADKVQDVATGIKGITDQISGAIGSAFTAVSNIYKADIAAIDEEITHLQNKNKDFTQQYKNQQAELAAAKEDTAERKSQIEREVAEEFSGYSQKQIEAEVDTRIAADETTRTLKNNEREKQEALDNSLKTKQEIERKERELQDKKAKEQAKQEKIDKLNRKVALIKSIGEATANVAQGVTKTLGAYPWPLNLALAAIIGTTGAVQVGIMTKQLAKFADGGLLRGKRHTQGGMRIEGTNMEVEGGEYVINRESTSKNLRLVRYINSQRKELTPIDMSNFFTKTTQGYEPPFRHQFESGGQLPSINTSSTINNEALIDAIKSIKINSKVAVTDIHRAQESMVNVTGWAGV